ncbi:hypothetical protein C8J56DRAFT_958407 [Mycena floridula]|nr:hypothetical protein C8J56DRAFT_958407 [Mycena floridula]
MASCHTSFPSIQQIPDCCHLQMEHQGPLRHSRPLYSSIPLPSQLHNRGIQSVTIHRFLKLRKEPSDHSIMDLSMPVTRTAVVHQGCLDSSWTSNLNAEHLDSSAITSTLNHSPATNPPLPSLAIISPILPSPIVVFPNRLGGAVTVGDVLWAIEVNMNRPYDQLFGIYPGLVPEYRKPRRWLDLFEGRIQFIGLHPSGESDTWVMCTR